MQHQLWIIPPERDQKGGSEKLTYSLAFLPIAPEHHDFLVLDHYSGRPPRPSLLVAHAEPSLRQRIMALGMKIPEEAAQRRTPSPIVEYMLAAGFASIKGA